LYIQVRRRESASENGNSKNEGKKFLKRMNRMFRQLRENTLLVKSEARSARMNASMILS
jgi:hypothetical protein